MKTAAMVLLGTLAAALAVSGPVRAQMTTNSVYTVKFVCGTQSPIPRLNPPSEPPVKPGNYATTINIEGLNATSVTTTVSVANGSSVAGPGYSLAPNQTVDITCADISSAVGASPSFITGFVNINPGSGALSVTAVYTSQGCEFPLFNSAISAPRVCGGPTSIQVVPQQFITPPPSAPAC
jgi:hypothetical protein